MGYLICFLSLLVQIEMTKHALIEVKHYYLEVKLSQDYLICGSEVAAYINEVSAHRLIENLDYVPLQEPDCAKSMDIQIRYQSEGVVEKPFPNYVLARGLY